MSIEAWLAFVLASAVLLVIPGPTILTVISYSLSHGARANVPLVAAVALGDSTALLASLLGLGAVLAASAFWFTVVKVVGGLYLLVLGLGMLRSKAVSLPVEAALDLSPKGGAGRLFAHTWLVTALNPKGIIFFTAFLPQFIDPAGDTHRQLWILAATFIALATLNASGYALFAAGARRLLRTPGAQRRFNLAGGGLLAAAGVWVLLGRRAAA
ncbi:MAG: LysE family translocator [Rhodocyclaceae bacterium]|nr:LysE family translocator [Rhodocyclaceae bacterium]